MKPKGKILSLLLAICLVVGLLPTTVFAADGDKSIMLGTSGISGYDSTDGYDYIYYGNWTAPDEKTTSGPIKWRVLDDQTNTGETGLFMLSDALLGTGGWGDVYFNQDGSSNLWQNSLAQAWCSNFYGSSFSEGEQGAVLATTKSDEEFTSSKYGMIFAASENILNGDKVFFLSAEEAENSVYGFANNNECIANYGTSAGSWWLRSPNSDYTDFAGVVNIIGYVDCGLVIGDWAARPAFNLDLNSVLFTSAAAGGKSSGDVGDDAIFKIGDYDGNEWKLTLLDSKRNFAVAESTASGKPGDTITLNYTGAITGTNEYISVIIANDNGTQYYGRIAQPTSTNGAVNLEIPDTLEDGTYTLNVFNEQYNGGANDDTKLTDYASTFETVELTVDATSPTLSNGSATRDSETTATVKFTSDEVGTCYYVAQDTEITLTNTAIAEQGTQQVCKVGENEIKLDNITTGAQYVALVVKDAAGLVSDTLKIEIPGYIVPFYGISADIMVLDFGSVAKGYTETPGAKEVTITNPSNQTVTVTLPTSTNYTITAGAGFINGTATLAINGTAKFTVQPKIGLDVGDYSETLTISGSNSTNARISLAFEVLDTYTLTVNLNGGSGTTTGGEYLAGEVVNIDASSRSNYRFSGWTSSNGGTFADPSSASTTFIMPAADTTITATWSYNGGGGSSHEYYTTTDSTGKDGSISPSGSGEWTQQTTSPQTGYDSNIAIWIAVIFATGVSLTGTVLYSRKRKYSR